MDTAFQTLQNRNYFALELSQLPNEEIQKLRYDFICDECKMPAYFRKAATSGQGPCFGARHKEGCGRAVQLEQDPWGEAGDDVVQRMEADETKIILNLGNGGGGVADGDGAGAQGAPQRGRHFGGGGDPHRTQMQRNPEKLLRLLVQAPTFRTSQLLIAGPRGEMPVSQFFVEMSVADRRKHAGEFHGFWGKPRFSNVWNGIRLFNGAVAPSLGFEIGLALEEQVVKKFGLREITDLRTRYVLFLGSPRITTNDSFMMEVRDVAHLAVMPEGFGE
jgi:hypothetical protein